MRLNRLVAKVAAVTLLMSVFSVGLAEAKTAYAQGGVKTVLGSRSVSVSASITNRGKKTLRAKPIKKKKTTATTKPRDDVSKVLPCGGMTGRVCMSDLQSRPGSWAFGLQPLPKKPSRPSSPTPPTPVNVEAVARRAALTLQLPRVAPQVGPDPSANEWNMAVVGHPLWLWVDSPRSMSSSVTEQGIAVSLAARLSHVSFNMGDGGRVSCTQFDAYNRAVKPGTPSPSCGYTYKRASLPKGRFHVDATAHWVVSWSALGQSGTLDVPVTGGRDLPVGELQAVLTG